MTTKPNALTVSINHERMAVLRSEEPEFETWLSDTPGQAFARAAATEGVPRFVGNSHLPSALIAHLHHSERSNRTVFLRERETAA